MNLVARLAVVIGLLGVFATWLFLGPLAGLGLQSCGARSTIAEVASGAR